MKKLLLATAALVAFATIGPAGAADMALKAPPPEPSYDWTGFYAGLNGGYSWGRDSGPLTLSDSVLGPLYSVSGNTALDGIIGGGQIGYNWQPSKNWVYGLEADIQASSEGGSPSLVCPGAPGFGVYNSLCSRGDAPTAAPPVTDSLSEKLDWFGTVRGRLGPTITPTLLAYVTGGLAYGGVHATDTVAGTNFTGRGVEVPAGGVLSTSTIQVGWTIGVGLEGVLSGNWTGKIEYLYMDLGTISGTFGTTITTPAGNTLVGSYSSHVTDNILRVGVDYHFGGPLVARY